MVFAGLRRDVPELLPALDVYVCSSDYEGVSLSILEAMARGRAVIATNVGGNPELIEPEQNGLLVPKGDAAAMGAAVVRVIGDGRLRDRFGRCAQATVRALYAH